RSSSLLLALGGALLAFGCADNDGGPAPAPAAEDNSVALSGGEGTTFTRGRNAFTMPAVNLSQSRRDPFFSGNALFNRNWVTAPASVIAIDGLGPTFNARSCSTCHFK